MTRGLILSLVAIAALAAAWWAFRPSPAPGKPEAGRTTAPPEAVPALEELRPEEPERPQGLPIAGLVVDGRFRGVAGVKLALGEEEAMSAESGRFEFPARRRSGRPDLAVLKEGQEIARWRGVFVGDSTAAPSEPEDPAEPASSLVNPPPGFQPSRLRWTVDLLGPAPETAVGGPAGPVARATAALVEDWGLTGQVRIDGASALPDGAHLDAVLYFDGERVVSSIDRAPVRRGAFHTLVAFPGDLRVHSAVYQLHLVFGAPLEDPLDVERWRTEMPEFPWAAADELQAVQELFVGDPDEAREDDRRIEAYYGETLDLVERLWKILSSRAREAERLAKGWDPELLKSRAAAAAWFGDPLVTAAGNLDTAAWRRFLDEGWRPEVRRLLDRHRARERGKYRSPETLLEEVLVKLLVLSKIESVLVYQALGLEPHPNDFFLDAERAEGDRDIEQQIFKKSLASLQRMRRLGN